MEMLADAVGPVSWRALAGPANVRKRNGASSVAVLMELAHLMPETDAKYGVDFVLFDGEELVYGGPTER